MSFLVFFSSCGRVVMFQRHRGTAPEVSLPSIYLTVKMINIIFFLWGYLVLLRVPNPCSCYVLPGLGLEKLDFDVKFIHNTAINPYFMCSKPLNSDKNDTGGGNQDFGKKSGLCFGMG